jgi:RecJ-like exonuclease
MNSTHWTLDWANRLDICPDCSGKGKIQGGGECPNCGGTGKVIKGIAGG